MPSGGQRSKVTLPAGFRPPLLMELTAFGYSGGRIMNMLSVGTDGVVRPEVAASCSFSIQFSTTA